MKVLVTGGAGYMGTELINLLVSNEAVEKVIVYDNLSRLNYNLFLGLKLQRYPKLVFVKGELLDSRSLKKALKDIRKAIKTTAPNAEEVISYQIPGYKYHGMLVFFAAWKNHISLYPAPWSADALKKEMSAYEGSKGTIKFPLDKPMPLSLVKKIVKYRLKENEMKASLKKQLKK